MYVRLATAWADRTGTVHRAGEVVDIDAITLAELEEQGVVENAGEEIERPEWVGPGEVGPEGVPDWVGPGEEGEPETADGEAGEEEE